MAAKNFYREPALKLVKQTVFSVPHGAVSFWHIYNQDAAITYLHLYNALAANVTVGTTTPDLTLIVPGSGWLDTETVNSQTNDGFLEFGHGLVVAASTAANQTGAPANGLYVNIGWR